MKEIVIATRNRHKYEEIVDILSNRCSEDKTDITNTATYLFAGDFPELPEIDETGSTLLENAILKAKATALLLNKLCIADDTGFFVEALDGEPGIYAARYAGANCTYDDNVNKLLTKMKDKSNRNAYFSTVSVLYCPKDGLIAHSEGKVKGTVTTERRGTNGFGYDPIFIPQTSEGRPQTSDSRSQTSDDKTYAELPDQIKNTFSHRYLSIVGLKDKIKEILC